MDKTNCHVRERKRKRRISLSCPTCPPPLFQTTPTCPTTVHGKLSLFLKQPLFPRVPPPLAFSSFSLCLCAYFDQLGLFNFLFMQPRETVRSLLTFPSSFSGCKVPIFMYIFCLLEETCSRLDMRYEWFVKYSEFVRHLALGI